MNNYSFHSSQHIRQKKEFQELFRKGFRLYGGFFVFRVLLTHNPKSKLGIMISKKFGKAVYRNRVRRIIRELFRQQHFTTSLLILVVQNKPFPNEIKAKQEINRAFALLSDRYLLKQISIGENVSVKYTQFSLSQLSLFAKLSFYLVYLYRKYCSKSLKMSCRFTPSCSVYAMEAFRLHGFWKGMYLTIKRLLQCHPLSNHQGFDPVPYRKKKKAPKK